jgi:hypothetical protein
MSLDPSVPHPLCLLSVGTRALRPSLRSTVIHFGPGRMRVTSSLVSTFTIPVRVSALARNIAVTRGIQFFSELAFRALGSLFAPR